MSKKRGVLISTKNHNKTVSKSKSAHTHPLPQHSHHHPLLHQHNEEGSKSGVIGKPAHEPLAESNLLSEQPQRLVNEAYYTYQDPDHMHHYDSNQLEENQQYVIESMQKRKQYLQYQREVQKAKLFQQNRISNSKINKKNKQKSPNKAKIPISDIQRIEKGRAREGIQKREKLKEAKRQRKQVSHTAILEPRPLVFSVNMFQKGNVSPRSRVNEQPMIKFPERIGSGTTTSRAVRQSSQYEQCQQGENLNCKRLPFRFLGIW